MLSLFSKTRKVSNVLFFPKSETREQRLSNTMMRLIKMPNRLPIAADFDKSNWQECALAYKHEAEAARIFRAVTILMNVKFRNGHTHIQLHRLILMRNY